MSFRASKRQQEKLCEHTGICSVHKILGSKSDLTTCLETDLMKECPTVTAVTRFQPQDANPSLTTWGGFFFHFL